MIQILIVNLEHMNTLSKISQEALLLSPGDADAKRIAALLEEIAARAGVAETTRASAKSAAALAKKLATKKSSGADLDALLSLLAEMEKREYDTAAASVTNDLVAEYLAAQDSVLEDFEELALNLVQNGAEGLRALRRQVHTWKGEAGIIGADDLAKSLHAIEDALDQVKPEQYQAVTDGMLELKDLVANSFACLKQNKPAGFDTKQVLNVLDGTAVPVAAPAPQIPEPAPIVTVEQPATQPAELPNTSNGFFTIQDGVDVELVGEFRTESEEHFANIEVGLMNLENDPSDADSVNNVFRAFHTVKGVASFVGVSYITELAHKAENLLDRVRKGTLVPDGPFVDLVFESMDLLRRMVQNLSNAIAEGRYAIPPNYVSLLHRLEHPEELAGAQRAADKPAKPEVVMAEQAAEVHNEQPAELPQTSFSAPEQASQREASAKSEGAAPSQTTDATVKVNMSRLDNLINMVGELVIAQAMVGQDPDILRSTNRKLTQNVAQLAKITRSLQELALSMRMVPVKATFQKMARLVRDVARKSNKLVEFEMTGDETELDRNVVEAIADPLVHMVRNAVDHGIEPADVRQQNGKPRFGTVTLSAAHEGGSVVITLRDDGRGLNRDKIIAKAIERGLVEPTAQLTDRDIYSLIFLPGFSTADKITDVSGRGVGMDVVRTNIEKLRGSVEIDSVAGQGSVFRIRLPLTLAIIDGMVMRVGSQRFIIPTITITESFRPLPKDIVTVHGRGEMVSLRGHLLPVCRLHSVFDVQDAELHSSNCIMIVAEAKANRVAIMADALLGQQQVVIKSLGKLFDGMDGVAGCAILGDGRISLILDIEGLLTVSRQSASIPVSVYEGVQA